MKVLVDLGPVRRRPAFRRLWIGSTVSAVGGQFTVFAAMYAVWTLTHSTLAVGSLGIVTAIPLLVIALVGATFIDSVDRAALARWVNIGQIGTALGLAAAAAAGSVVSIMLLTAGGAGLGALGGPARRALIPSVVPRGELGAAYALNSLSFQVAMLVGPGLAGLLAGQVGVPTCFVVDAVSFGAGLLGLRGLRTAASTDTAARGYRAALDGLRFAAHTPVVRGALLCDLGATALAMPMALFPAINQARFGGDPETLGLFTTAVAVGGVLGSALSGTITRRSRPGLAMTACALTWGAALTVAGLATLLPVLLIALAVAGMADTWSVVSRGTVIQSGTPDHLRGRISALEQVIGAGGPDVGNFRAGVVAALAGAGPAMAIGGLSCVAAVAVVMARVPQLRAYRSELSRPVHAA
ncbi:MFS transporter [Leekyejoonella antrihumi]|uniref:MFS transporter n=1 Tax=Leekyejoonella antrihumi TaxID=1660198 RepID=A0A563DVY5_9MICO|nr:MFS transporter [Leekyejoonella antrihumi]TWP33884.1 MFS transporter [Leekyejoonella antrihumi]